MPFTERRVRRRLQQATRCALMAKVVKGTVLLELAG